MRRFVTFIAFLLASGVLPLTPPSVAAQALAVYDDFSTARIDGARWYGYEYVTARQSTATFGNGWGQPPEDMATSDPAVSVVNARAATGIVNGRLRLALTTHGARETAGVAEGRGRLGMRMVKIGSATPVARLRAKLIVSDATAEPCGDQPSRSRAQLKGHFGSTADPDAEPASRDVFATLSLERHTTAGDRVIGVVSRCRDADCNVAEDLGFVTFTRSWTAGTVYLLTITHVPDTERFVFAVSGGGVPAEMRTVAYPGPAALFAPVKPIRDVLVENSPAVCTSADGSVPRPAVAMDAAFDDVAIAMEED